MATGQLEFVDSTVDQASGTVQVKASMPNQDLTLWPGQFVDVVLDAGVMPKMVSIPTVAVQPGQKGSFVYVVGPNSKVEERPVEIALVHGDNSAVSKGVKSGERVLVTAGGRRVGLPALVLPGVADGTVVVELGYGREAAGRVGNGVGGDTYRLRSSAALWHVPGAVVSPTWGGHQVALTQTHWELEGRSLIREATLAEYRQHPDFARDPAHGERVPAVRRDVDLDGRLVQAQQRDGIGAGDQVLLGEARDRDLRCPGRRREHDDAIASRGAFS